MDLFYNGILVVIVLVWALSLRARRMGRLLSGLRRWGPAVILSLWILFLLFTAWYALNLEYFDEIHDIDEAVETAVESTANGVNPYEEFVVPRFKDKYSPTVGWELGPYNYMPLDLLTYIGARSVLGFLGDPIWFVATNMMFSGLAMYLLWRVIRVSWLSFVPIAGSVMLFYSMDNASLTFLLMVGSVYVLRSTQRHPEALSLFIMGLAVVTKVYAAIPFLVMLVFFVQSSVVVRDWRRLSATLAAAAAAATVALLLMWPFGIWNVLDAAVFFHTSEALREGTSAGGTLLSELALGSEYFAVIGVALAATAVVLGLWVRNLNDRVLIVIVTFLLIAVKSSLAPLTVAGLFLALRMKDLVDEAEAAHPAVEIVDESPEGRLAECSAASER